MEKEQKQTIFKALNSVIKDLRDISKDEEGFKYKYASMRAILSVVNPALMKHGLSIFHTVERNETGVYLKSTLAHVEGETIDTCLPLFFKPGDMKELGGAITYARRYAMHALLNLSISDYDIDEDQSEEENKSPKENLNTKLSNDQLMKVREELRDHKEILEKVLQRFGAKSVEEIPSNKAASLFTLIYNLKKQAV